MLFRSAKRASHGPAPGGSVGKRHVAALLRSQHEAEVALINTVRKAPSQYMKEAKDLLIQQIKEAEAVLVLPSMYEAKPDLVNFIMDGADAAGKPLIVLRPFGGVAETPQPLIDRTNEHIKWDAREMVDALKRQARLEDTNRWESLDFPGYDANGEIK